MSYCNLIYHIVFRTKNSTMSINESNERSLYSFIHSYILNHQGVLIRVNGMPDHVHILASLPPTVTLSDFIRDLKSSTSKYMSSRRDLFPYFVGWGKEYFACTVSEGARESVRQYIMGQKTHHKKVSTHDEIMRLCKEMNIEVNEKYIQ